MRQFLTISEMSNLGGRGGSEDRAAILRDRLDLLYRTLPLSQVVALAVAVILFSFNLSQEPDTALMAWFAVTGCALSLRIASAFAYRYRRGWLSSDTAWLAAFRLGAFLAGSAWGLSGILLFPPDDVTVQAVTILVLAGVTGGALSSMAADAVAYRGFVMLALFPACTLALIRGEEVQTSIGFLVLLMIFFLVRTSGSHQRSIIASLELSYENADLVAELDKERRRLVNETETMIGKILSCAPIGLWAVDRHGRMTYCDFSRLGWRVAGREPRAGDDLFAVIDRHPKLVTATRAALAGVSSELEVQVQGGIYEAHCNPLPGNDTDSHGAIGIAIDISERKRHEQTLAQLAHYDSLTGLPNRTRMASHVDQTLEHAKRNRERVALLFIDLDNFKAVNDTKGHDAGDALLQQAAHRLTHVVRASDMVSRLGGDEFLIVSGELEDLNDARTLAQRVAASFREPFSLDGNLVFTSASIGIAVYPDDGQSRVRLIQRADTAMYHAKSLGKGSYRFFTEEMQQTAERQVLVETELRQAIDRNELYLCFQPQIDLDSRRVRGAEALLRWRSKVLGEVAPDEFIPLAEQAGLMPEIGTWVLRNACQHAVRWMPLYNAPVKVAVNVSPQQIRHGDLLANVVQALKDTGLPGDRLELEITENLLIEDASATNALFRELHTLGVCIALDDFGTGYSSLSYLQRIPLQILKIDKAFVQRLGSSNKSHALVDAIIAMAQGLHMQVVAEGVEEDGQLLHLQRSAVDIAQGYLFSKPIAPAAFENLLASEPWAHRHDSVSSPDSSKNRGMHEPVPGAANPADERGRRHTRRTHTANGTTGSTHRHEPSSRRSAAVVTLYPSQSPTDPGCGASTATG